MFGIIAASAASSASGIQFVGSTGTGVTLSATASITLPSGLQPGDLVIVATASDVDSANYATGYTAGQQGVSNSVSYQWCYKIMPNPVDTTATGLTNQDRAAHLAVAFRGISQSNPLDVTPPTISTSTTLLPDSPAITTSTNNAMVVSIGFLDDDLVAAGVIAPTNYTLGASSQSTESTVMAAYRLIPTAGTENPAAFTGSGSDSWVASTVALRPA